MPQLTPAGVQKKFLEILKKTRLGDYKGKPPHMDCLTAAQMLYKTVSNPNDIEVGEDGSVRIYRNFQGRVAFEVILIPIPEDAVGQTAPEVVFREYQYKTKPWLGF